MFDNVWQNSLIIAAMLAVVSAAPYSKYGRGCADIGCLPSEVCVMQHDSCAYGQRENKECGSYPSCKKSTSAPSGQGIITLNPAPDNTRFSHTSDNRRPSNPVTVDPNQIFGQPPAWSNYPQIPVPITPPPGIMNYPHYPPNPNSGYMGQFPPPPYYGGTGNIKPREPSLLDQFLYNKSGGKNGSSRLATSFSQIQLTLVAGISLIAFKIFC